MKLGFENTKQSTLSITYPASSQPHAKNWVYSAQVEEQLLSLFTAVFKREVKRRTSLVPHLRWLLQNLVQLPVSCAGFWCLMEHGPQQGNQGSPSPALCASHERGWIHHHHSKCCMKRYYSIYSWPKCQWQYYRQKSKLLSSLKHP